MIGNLNAHRIALHSGASSLRQADAAFKASGNRFHVRVAASLLKYANHWTAAALTNRQHQGTGAAGLFDSTIDNRVAQPGGRHVFAPILRPDDGQTIYRQLAAITCYFTLHRILHRALHRTLQRIDLRFGFRRPGHVVSTLAIRPRLGQGIATTI